MSNSWDQDQAQSLVGIHWLTFQSGTKALIPLSIGKHFGEFISKWDYQASIPQGELIPKWVNQFLNPLANCLVSLLKNESARLPSIPLSIGKLFGELIPKCDSSYHWQTVW